jgi:hypothetical protein
LTAVPPRFFDEDDRLYCEAGGRVFRVIDAGGQRWFVPMAAWNSRFKGRIVDALELAAQTFAEMLDAGVPIEEARQVLPGAAMMNLEFEETFGEGEQL